RPPPVYRGQVRATLDDVELVPPANGPPPRGGRTISGSVSKRTKVRVLVADDHPLYREGVVRALTASGLVDVVAEAEGGREALAEIQAQEPDVALLDYKLPDLDGVAVAHAVTRDHLPTRVLLLSAFTDSGLVYKALQAGASGYLPKEARREQIVDAV